ncbi:hypothetical protein KY290_029950, partial [Solanum tuberosum]
VVMYGSSVLHGGFHPEFAVPAQCCMNEVMKDSDDHNYKVPHMNKERLERENDLPLQVRCDVDAINHALTLLQR